MSGLPLPADSAAVVTLFGLGRVEDGRGSLGPTAIAPFPIPAHQTGRADFRHPAFRLASPQGTRRAARRERSKHWRAPPLPCNRAFSEGSGSFQALPGSSPITFTSPSLKAPPKAGSLCPPPF